MDINIKITEEDKPQRLDVFLTSLCENKYSRNFLKEIIKKGQIKVDNRTVKPNYSIRAGITIKGKIDNEPKEVIITEKEIDFGILFENDDLLIINKPANLITHPLDSGAYAGSSLVSGLIHYLGRDHLSDIGGELRPGIVHRLDMDTSGILIIVKNNETHKAIVDLLRNRNIKKTYLVLVKGHLEQDKGIIDSPIERNKKNPSLMRISPDGKDSITEYEVLSRHTYKKMNLSLIKVNLISGRTHQIRVHFKAIGHSVCGDVRYGDRKLNKLLKEIGLNRQFVHSHKVEFNYKKEDISIECPLSDDLQQFLDQL